MSVTIYRRDGSVLFRSETATTQRQAIAEIVAKARANLSRANLSRANLSWADLSRVNLSWADLSRANLSSANLSGANLSGVDLSGADLSGANLSSANLLRANLSRANLSRANLSWANLSRAYNAPQRFELGPIDTWGISVTLEPSGWVFRAGCRTFTLDEARAHWAATNQSEWSAGATSEHGARMLAGVDALIALAKAHGWPERAEPVATPAEAAVSP